ncbi:MAG TPA: hypothetical protein VGH30_09310 [Jatrophihabitantaceae bacterium]|jgi:MFS family permease
MELALPPSSRAADWLLLVVIVGLLSLVAAAILVARARQRVGRRPMWLAAGFAGLATAAVCAFGGGMRHYGGNTTVGENATTFRCQAWWSAVEQHSSGVCKHAAQGAVLPVALSAAAAGVVVAGLVATILELRRRRNERSINDLRLVDAP